MEINEHVGDGEPHPDTNALFGKLSMLVARYLLATGGGTCEATETSMLDGTHKLVLELNVTGKLANCKIDHMEMRKQPQHHRFN